MSKRYVVPWWSHALSAAALLVISVAVFAPRAVELLEAGRVGWYAAGAFVSLFLGLHRLALARRTWRARKPIAEDTTSE